MSVIASGASLSGELSVKGITMIAVDGWTSAVMSFQVKSASGACYDAYDDAGNEITVGAAFAGARVIALPSALLGVSAIRVRSGTSSTPTNQGALRTIAVVE